jgi:AcrR family transcriptional regulator
MSQRQKIGLRKTHSAMHKRGVERRKKLLKAAYELLSEREIGDISFRDIADQAGVPEGSAYHFFANRFDIFSALASDLSALFVAEHRRPVPGKYLVGWRKLAEHFLESGVRVYRKNPPARQLLIGGQTPPEVKQADRINDRAVAQVMTDIFSTHFSVETEIDLNTVFYHFIEITDLILTLSVIEHGEITDGMIEEAKLAGIGYLANFFEESRHR